MNKLIAILHKILLSKKAAALFTFIFVLFLAAVVAFGALPAKVYLDAARARASDAIANIVPQAWGFFYKKTLVSLFIKPIGLWKEIGYLKIVDRIQVSLLHSVGIDHLD